MKRNHMNLDVWKQAMELVMEIYSLTSSFPDCEKFGLTNQMRRAAVSIPSNIAEGAGKQTDKEFLRHLYHARGSLAELETQLMIADKLRYFASAEILLEATNALFAKLSVLINKITRDIAKGV